MPNATQVANIALMHLQQARITNFNEDTTAARRVRDAWDIARDEALRVHPWGFARKQAILTPSADTPLFHWQYQFPIPSDFRRLVRFNGILAGTSKAYFDILGQNIVANTNEAEIEYVFNEVQVENWDAGFVSAFAWKLAEYIAPALLQDGGRAAALAAQQTFQSALSAMCADRSESKPRVITAVEGSGYLQARRYGADYYPLGPGLPVQYGVGFNPWNVS